MQTPPYLDRNLEHTEINEVIEGVITVFYLTSEAISCFRAFAFTGTHLVNSHILQINAASLQYFMITQFCKLTERSGKPDEGQSSLYRLNHLLKEKHPEWNEVYRANSKMLKEIIETPFFDTIATLRNKCYGHSTTHPDNHKMGFKYFTSTEFEDYQTLFRKAIEVFRNIFTIYDNDHTDYSYVYNDTRPLNFLKNHKKYQEFYLNNHLKLTSGTSKTKDDK